LRNSFEDSARAGIIRAFDLRYQPQLFRGDFYRWLAVCGHLGRMDVGLPWEKTEQAAALR
jgi:S-adenosylmethionine synthetase